MSVHPCRRSRTIRPPASCAVGNARRTLRAGFTTVRNLGLFVKTGGYLLDVALGKAIDAGWIDGPRIVPAGHAITPTGGHLDPTMFAAFAPGIMDLTLEEGIANGVDEVRKAVRYQIKYGAQLIKVCVSGGVMSMTGSPGAQHYSFDEAVRHRRRGPSSRAAVASHTHGAEAVKQAIRAGIDCIEHGFLIDDEAIQMLVDNDTFLVPTTRLADAMDTSHAAPELQAKAAEMFPKARISVKKAATPGSRSPSAPMRRPSRTAKRRRTRRARLPRGMSNAAVLRAATVERPSSSRSPTAAAWPRDCWPTSSPYPAIPGRHDCHPGCSFRHEGGQVYVNK